MPAARSQSDRGSKGIACRTVAVLLSGAGTAIALPPFSFWPAGWLTTPLLIWAVAGGSIRAGALCGIGFALSVGALSLPWLPQSLVNFFHIPAAWSVPATFASFVVAGGWCVVAFGAWAAWLARRAPVSPLLLGLGFGLAEFVRGIGPLANPVLGLSATQVPAPALVQSAAFWGAAGLSTVMAIVGGFLAEPFSARIRSHPWERVLLAGLVGLLVIAALTERDEDLRGEPVPVWLVQGATPRDERFDPATQARRLDTYLASTRSALEEAGIARTPVPPGQRADPPASGRVPLVVWPEQAIAFPVERDFAARSAIADLSREYGVDLVFGAVGLPKSTAPDAGRTNRVFLVRGGGVWAGERDKQRLIPLGETRAFGRWPESLDPLVPGTSDVPLRASSGHLGIAVCSEVMFAGDVARRVRAGAELLLNPANDGWLVAPAARELQRTYASLRAVETRRWLLRATVDGVTSAIAPSGRTVARAPLDAPAVLRTEARFRTEQTPFVRYGALVPWVLGGAVALGTARHRLRGREPTQ